MNTAIVYDRVNKWGGAERVLLVLHEMFPDAPLYTAVYDESKAPWAKIFPKVIPSFLQKIPGARGKHELLGALTPLAFETFNFDKYDLVISVTSEAAKGIITKPGTLHVCYCLTPTRYLWSHHDFYFENPPEMFRGFPFFRYISKPIVGYLRSWDKIAAQRPDVMVGISNAVVERIKKYYKRKAKLIHSPTEIEHFRGQRSEVRGQRSEYFLYVSRLIPYKRADIAVKAFNKINLPLVVVGTGSEERKLKKIAKKNIKFVGEVNSEELVRFYQRAKALIFPGEEDFGLVIVEAQAAGTPVIAYRKGGALDTVTGGKTGMFFDEQSVQSLIGALKKFNGKNFDNKLISKNAQKFSKEIFKDKMLKLIDESLKDKANI